MLSVLFALLSAFSNACTAVLQRLANASASEQRSGGWRIALYLVRDPLWLLGLAFLIGTFLFSAAALYFGSLAVVQPLLVTELLFTLALRHWWVHDAVERRLWFAAVVMCAGLAGFLGVAQPSDGTGTPGPDRWAVALSVCTVAVVVLFVLGRRGSPVRRAALLGCAAGLVWAVDAGFVKSATTVLSRDGWVGLFEHWPVYALVATGVLGTLLLQTAFHAGPLSASQPGILITDPLTSIVLGVALFGEQLRTGVLAVTAQVLALAVMAGGVVLVTRWAPPPLAPGPRGTPAT